MPKILNIFIFIFWLSMMGLLIQRNTFSYGNYLSPNEILGYQPSDKPYFFVIYQQSVPVGYSEGFIGETDQNGKTTYHLTERTRLILAMGKSYREVDMFLKTEVGELFNLKSFQADVLTENDRFKVEGAIQNKILNLSIESSEEKIEKSLPLKQSAALPVTLAPYLASRKFEPNITYAVDLLDPLTLGTNTAKIKLVGLENITVLGKTYRTNKFEISLKEIVSYIYLDETGEKIKEDLGDGLVAVRETRGRVRKIEQFLDALKRSPVD